MPRMATRSPGTALVLRSASNVVTPAQLMGAASAKDSSFGIRASAFAGTITDSAYPPGYCQLGTCNFSQKMKEP